MKDSIEIDIQETAPARLENLERSTPSLKHDVLILDAKLRQSLVSVRSLGQRGIRTVALEVAGSTRTIPTFSSRWCRESFIAPVYEEETEPFLSYLEEVIGQTGVRVVIPSADGTLALLRDYRDRFTGRVNIAMGGEPGLGIAINKTQTLEIAERLGLGVPRGMHVNGLDDLPQALKEIGLPAVIKPVESWLWGDTEQKAARLICALVTTPDEAREAVEELTALGGSTLFQQFLSGEREAVSIMYANGEVYARFAQWARRTQPPLGGTSVFRQSIAIPSDIGDQSERLIREINLEGYSEIEFRRDGEGKPYLMEINPRLSASVEVAVRAGVDFPYLIYQWANGDKIDHVKGYRTGGWMRYLEGDILTTAQSFTQRGRPGVNPPVRAVFDFFTSFFIPSGYDYVDWKDLRPAMSATVGFGQYVVQRLGRGRTRRKS